MTSERKIPEFDRYGVSTAVCELCDEPLGPPEDWVRGNFEPSAAHKRCLKARGIVR